MIIILLIYPSIDVTIRLSCKIKNVFIAFLNVAIIELLSSINATAMLKEIIIHMLKDWKQKTLNKIAE